MTTIIIRRCQRCLEEIYPVSDNPDNKNASSHKFQDLRMHYSFYMEWELCSIYPANNYGFYESEEDIQM